MTSPIATRPQPLTPAVRAIFAMRVSLAIAVLLQLCTGSHASTSGLAPADVPSNFLISFYGFMGAGQAVILRKGVLVYTQNNFDGTKHQKEVKPSLAQWRRFRQTLDAINVWRWQARYSNPNVADGLRWELDITYSDHAVHSEGANDNPDGFDKLRSAVVSLLGVPQF
jgi:hypothetical protein